MNIKRFVGAAFGVFASSQIYGFIEHGLILNQTYISLKEVWRPDMQDKLWIMTITSFVFSFFFVYVFTKGYEGKGLFEGVRFGLIIGIMMNVVGMFNQYAIYPIPLSLQ